MAIHKPVTQPGIYFITFTCYKWLPLIDMVNGYDLVYNWFDILLAKGHATTGYVIMPNHLHLLLHYSGGAQSLNTLVGNGKRFMAYDIVKRLEQQTNGPFSTAYSLLLKPAIDAGVKNMKYGKIPST
jgi:REP element-mobilizing transposase RayT